MSLISRGRGIVRGFPLGLPLPTQRSHPQSFHSIPSHRIASTLMNPLSSHIHPPVPSYLPLSFHLSVSHRDHLPFPHHRHQHHPVVISSNSSVRHPTHLDPFPQKAFIPPPPAHFFDPFSSGCVEQSFFPFIIVLFLRKVTQSPLTFRLLGSIYSPTFLFLSFFSFLS